MKEQTSAVLSDGFSMLPRRVLLDRRLNSDAIKIYSYFMLFVNHKAKERLAYPQVKRICKDLALSRRSFYKAKAQLEECGYIDTLKKSGSSGYVHNAYLLVDNPEAYLKEKAAGKNNELSATVHYTSQESRKRKHQRHHCVSTDSKPSSNGGTQSISNNKNKKINPSINPNSSREDSQRAKAHISHSSEIKQNQADNLPSSVKTAYAEEINLTFKALINSAVNRNLIYRPETRQAYDSLIEQGFAAEEIQQAWDTHQEKLREEARETRFYTQLQRWLLGNGPTDAKESIWAARENDPDRRRIKIRDLVNPHEFKPHDERIAEMLYDHLMLCCLLQSQNEDVETNPEVLALREKIIQRRDELIEKWTAEGRLELVA